MWHGGRYMLRGGSQATRRGKLRPRRAGHDRRSMGGTCHRPGRSGAS